MDCSPHPAESHYAGSDWIQSALDRSCSPLGKEVADVLGAAFYGIYHLNHSSLLKVEWENPIYICINLDISLSTFDNNYLTRLVVFCHDRMLRMEIDGKGPGWLQLLFHMRSSRAGRIDQRCPTIDDHVKLIHVPSDLQVKEP